MVDLALKTLFHDRLRFAITLAGVAFAVMLVLVQVGLFLGLLRNASLTIEKVDADLWVTSRNTPNVDIAHRFPEGRTQRVRSVPGVARADNLIVAFMNLSLPTGAEDSVLVYALEDFGRWGIPWSVVDGQVEDLRRGRYLFIDESAEQRFGKFGPGDHREVVGQRLEIIGRSREARSFTTTPIAFMDYRLAQELLPATLRGNTDYVLVKLAPGANLEAVRREIQRRLPYNDVHSRDEWAAQSRRYWIDNTGLGLNLYVTVFLGALVGIVVVAQTLYASTMEHLKEFGTVKAIGGSNRDIYSILLRQAGLAALVGFALGAVPAFALQPLVARAGLQLVIPPPFIALVFVGTVVMCAAAAMISFHKVATIDPALVFRA
jgi:putative ABC transport system permease protein